MKKNIIPIGLLIMILINGFLIYLLLQRRPPHRNTKGGISAKIIKKLALDEEQTTQFKTLAREHHQVMNQLDRKQRALLKSYFNQLNAPTNAGNASDSLLVALELIERKKIITTYQHFEDLKALCTQDQLANFEHIMNDILQVLLNEQQKNPPPPRDF